MKRFLAGGAAAFLVVAAVPSFASDVTREDPRAAQDRQSRAAETTRAIDKEACACAMHSRHGTPDRAPSSTRPLEELGSEPAQFTDVG